MKKQKLIIGSRVLVNFKPSYYRGDGTSGYGTYVGYDRSTKKYKVEMDEQVGIQHHEVKRDKISGGKYLSDKNKTYHNAVAYVDREQIVVINKVRLSSNKSIIKINSKSEFEKIRPKLKVCDRLKFLNDITIWKITDIYDSDKSYYIDLSTSGDGWITLIIDKKTNKVNTWEGFDL